MGSPVTERGEGLHRATTNCWLFPSTSEPMESNELQTAHRIQLCMCLPPLMTEHLSPHHNGSNMISVLCYILNFRGIPIFFLQSLELESVWGGVIEWRVLLFCSNMHTHTNLSQGLSPALRGNFAKAVRQEAIKPLDRPLALSGVCWKILHGYQPTYLGQSFHLSHAKVTDEFLYQL